MDVERKNLQDHWLSLEESIIHTKDAVNKFARDASVFILARDISASSYLRDLAEFVETSEQLNNQLLKLGKNLAIKPTN